MHQTAEDILKSKYGHLFTDDLPDDDLTEEDILARGGKITGQGADPDDGKSGGFLKGRSHAQGGIQAYNKDTGQPIEMEGNEVVITRPAVEDPTKRSFQGQMLTNRQILSRINESGGGVKFADGGPLDNLDRIYCSGQSFEYGGSTMEDFRIVSAMEKDYTFREISPIYIQLMKFIENEQNQRKD
jgi:hypothetical protein